MPKINITGGPNGAGRVSWAAARKTLQDMDYMVVTSVDGLSKNIIGLEVYCSALSMSEHEAIIKVLLPDFTVWGNTNSERIYVEEPKINS